MSKQKKTLSKSPTTCNKAWIQQGNVIMLADIQTVQLQGKSGSEVLSVANITGTPDSNGMFDERDAEL